MDAIKEVLVIGLCLLGIALISLFGLAGYVVMVLVLHPFTYIAAAVMFTAWMIWG